METQGEVAEWKWPRKAMQRYCDRANHNLDKVLEQLAIMRRAYEGWKEDKYVEGIDRIAQLIVTTEEAITLFKETI